MKLKVLILFFLCTPFIGFAQTTSLPDANFEQALIDLGIDTNGLSGDILNADAESVIGTLDVGSKAISDLSGIEAFTSITTVIIYDNLVTSLDVSSNTALVTVSCGNNQLTSLNVSGNSNLKFLYCQGNQLTSLDVSENTVLVQLHVQNNSLTSLDVSNNPLLETLVCGSNELTSLDVSSNTALIGLNCSGNDLIDLDVSGNPALNSLSCSGNYNLLTLNVKNGNNINFTNFSSVNNFSLTCIEVDDAVWSTENWTNIYSGNSFSENCNVYVPDDNFEQALIDLGYDFGPLDDYIPTANVNSIISLDVSNKSINDLTGIESFMALEQLLCQNNQLSTLDVTQNTALSQLNVSGNTLASLDVKNGNNTNFTSFDATGNSGLVCIQVDNAVWSAANWTNIDAASSFSSDCTLLGVTTDIPDDNFEQALIDLGYDDVLDNSVATANINTLTDLAIMNENILDLTGIEDFDSLTTLICFGNELTSLDVSNNTQLTTLFCNGNQLTSLDVTNNVQLSNLKCNDNNLTSLDVSHNLNLYSLSVNGNQLTSLDVSANTALTTLTCQTNELTALDISANSLISLLYCHSNKLVRLNVKNGNNTNFTLFNASGNADLVCIEVDDVSYSTANWTDIDAGTNFSEDCQYDDDGDGVTNEQETTDSTDPFDGCSYLVANQVISNVSSAWNLLDCDCDGAMNGDEIIAGNSPLPSPPTGSSDQSFCSADNPTITNLVVSGENVQWYNTSSGGSPLSESTPLVEATSYHASQTVNDCEESDRLEVTVTVSDAPTPTGPIEQVFCPDDNPTVTDLSANGTNIQWYEASLGGAPLAAATPLDDGNYYASQTISSCESDRLEINVNLDAVDPPTGDPIQSFCLENDPTVADLVATGTNIQWYDKFDDLTPLPSTAPLTDRIYAYIYGSQTIGSCESERLQVLVDIITVAHTPTGPSFQNFCTADGPTIADIEVTGTNIKWYDAYEGGNELLTGTSLVDNTSYYASQTTNICGESIRFEAIVTVNDPAIPTGTIEQVFCIDDNPTVADLSASGTDIQWYIANTGGAPLSGTTPVATSKYYASQTIDGCESDRLEVNVTLVNPDELEAPTGDATQSFCYEDSPTVADLVASGTNMQWYDVFDDVTPLPSTAPLTDREFAYIYGAQMIGSCESERLQVLVDIITVAGSPTGPSFQNFCSSDNPTLADVSATGTDIKWYDAFEGGTELPTSTSLVDNTSYYASQTTNICGESIRFEANVTVEDCTVTGIEQNTPGMVLYPTVTSSGVTVELDHASDEVSIRIIDMQGKTKEISTYHLTNKITFDLAGSNGIYLVDVRTDTNDSYTFRVVKN